MLAVCDSRPAHTRTARKESRALPEPSKNPLERFPPLAFGLQLLKESFDLGLGTVKPVSISDSEFGKITGRSLSLPPVT